MKLSKEKACFVISETNFDQGEKLFLSDLVLVDILSNTHFHSNLHFAKKNKRDRTYMYSENSLSVPDLIVSEYISMETERNRHGIHLIGGYSSSV